MGFLTLGPHALLPDNVAPNDPGSHSCNMLEGSVELSVAALWERGVVGTVAGMAVDMDQFGGDHTADKEAVGDTVAGIAAGMAAGRLDFHILVEVGDAAAIVQPYRLVMNWPLRQQKPRFEQSSLTRLTRKSRDTARCCP